MGRAPRSSRSQRADLRSTAIDEATPERQRPAEIAGDAYGELIADQLAGQRTRKESFERRGFSVITSSGVVVSVLLAIAAVIVSRDDASPPGLARWAFVSALLLFAVAFVLGIIVNVPRSHEQARAKDLRPLLEDRFWLGRPATGKFRAAEVRLKILDWSERVNDRLGRLLIAALIAELLALVAVAVAVGALLLAG